MKFVFLDESGNKGIKGTRFYIQAALIINVDDYMNGIHIVEEVKQYFKKHFNVELKEVKSREIRTNLKNVAMQQGIKDENAIHKWINEKILKIFDIMDHNLKEYKIICICIDQLRFRKIVNEKLRDIYASLDKLYDRLKGVPYFSVLSNEQVEDIIRQNFLSIFNDLENELIVKITSFQTITELLLRLERYLETINDEAMLIYDADAKSFEDSLYILLSRTLRQDGVPRAIASPISLSKIKSFFIMDSKKNPFLQLADVIVGAMVSIIVHGERNFYNKLFDHFVSSPQDAHKIWGYGIKVLPWSESEFNKLLGLGE